MKKQSLPWLQNTQIFLKKNMKFLVILLILVHGSYGGQAEEDRIKRKVEDRFKNITKYLMAPMDVAYKAYKSDPTEKNARHLAQQAERVYGSWYLDLRHNLVSDVRKLFDLVKDEKQKLQRCNNQLQSARESAKAATGKTTGTTGTTGQKTFWQRLNTPPEPYRSRYPNDPKRAWREYHRDRERQQMENSR